MRRRRVPPELGRTPGDRAGKFPGYDVVDQQPNWDVVTAGVVLRRLGPPPPIRFFTRAEEAVAAALVDQLLDQREEPKVPVLAMIDARLAESQTDGWHYHNLPDDGQAWRDTLRALDQDGRQIYGAGFTELDWTRQGRLVYRVQRRGEEDWHGMPAARVWSLWTRYAATAFYSHPFAWNEIGFGGPAYPRGYKNLGLDRREPWEVADRDPGRDLVRLALDVEDARRRDAAAHPDPPVIGLPPEPPAGPDREAER